MLLLAAASKSLQSVCGLNETSTKAELWLCARCAVAATRIRAKVMFPNGTHLKAVARIVFSRHKRRLLQRQTPAIELWPLDAKTTRAGRQ